MASSPLSIAQPQEDIEPAGADPLCEMGSDTRHIGSVIVFALINLAITVTVFTALFSALAR